LTNIAIIYYNNIKDLTDEIELFLKGGIKNEQISHSSFYLYHWWTYNDWCTSACGKQPFCCYPNRICNDDHYVGRDSSRTLGQIQSKILTTVAPKDVSLHGQALHFNWMESFFIFEETILF